LEGGVHELPVGVAGIIRDDDNDIRLLGEQGNGKEEREGGLDHSDERRVLPGPI
jgi:hypothetical protein